MPRRASAAETSTGYPLADRAVVDREPEDEVTLGGAAIGGGHGVEEERARREVDHRRAGDPERIDVPAGQGSERDRCTDLLLPDLGAGRRVERVHPVALGRDQDEVLAGGVAVEVEGLGVGRSLGDGGEPRVAVHRRSDLVRERGLHVDAVAGRAPVVLEDARIGRDR